MLVMEGVKGRGRWQWRTIVEQGQGIGLASCLMAADAESVGGLLLRLLLSMQKLVGAIHHAWIPSSIILAGLADGKKKAGQV